MKIQFKILRYAGNLADERIVFSVLQPDDVGQYLVLQVVTSEEGTGASNNIQRSYWFPDKKVKSGDLVVLYTKDGTEKEKQNATGTTTHFFYWGHKIPIWNERKRTLVLMRSTDWAAEVLQSGDEDAE